MKIPAILFTAFILAACGGQDDFDAARAGGNSDSDVTFCSCVNEIPTTNAKVAACTAMLNALTPEEAASKTLACRQALAVPEGGPDLCFCLKSSSRDPDVRKACDAILPDDMTPREISAKLVACSQ